MGTDCGGWRGDALSSAPGAGGAASPVAPPGPRGSPEAAVPGRGAGGGREAAPIKGREPGGAGRAERSAAAAAMGMLNLPGFLSCGKKKKVGMGEAQGRWGNSSRYESRRAGEIQKHLGRYESTWAGVGGQVRVNLSRQGMKVSHVGVGHLGWKGMCTWAAMEVLDR